MVPVRYGKIQVFDNLLPAELYQELLDATQRIGWHFGWRTPGSHSNLYWHHEVGRGAKNNTQDISGNVKKHPLPVFAKYQDWLLNNLVPSNCKVLRFYLNAHTYGTDGWPHTDTDRGEELTTVFYLTTEWRPEWCGETVIFKPNGDIAAAVLPRPNRLLTFPSASLHAPRPLEKGFSGLRIVLVVKFAPPNGVGAEFNRSLPAPE